LFKDRGVSIIPLSLNKKIRKGIREGIKDDNMDKIIREENGK